MTLNLFRIVFILSLLMACKKEPQPIVYEKGISLELAEKRFKTISNVTYQYIFDIPETKTESIEASTTIQFNLSDKSEDLALDFTEKTIHSIDVNAEKIKVQQESQHLILPKEQLKLGTNSINIKFTAGNLSLNRNDDFLYTLLVPARASSVFPCFDQPDIKARYKLTLLVPKTWEAVANGEKTATTLENDKKKITYSETKPISTYLFAFAAGKFESIEREIDGRKFTLYHRETDLEKVNRNLDAIFTQHAQAYHWLEEYTGIQNPYKDYEFVAIPSFQYGGMEHPGAIWYRANSLFLEKDPTRMSQMNRANLIAHEVAHMWFGNLVTMKWFDDVWLKEVFANFMAGKIIQPDFEDINHQLLFLESNYPSAYRVDRTEGTHPVQQKLDNLNNAGSLYGRIIYNKAPILIQHLENKIGEKKLQKGLQEYLKTYQNSNATWDQLITILSQVSNEDLSSWDQNWIKSSGMPHYTIDLKDTNLLTIYQNGKVYEQRLNIQIIKNSQIVETHSVLVNQKEQSLTITTKNPDFINLFGNHDEYGYYELNSQGINWLSNAINHEPNDTKRYVYWLILYENFLNAKIPPTQLLNTALEAVRYEKNSFILNKALSIVNTTHKIYFSLPKDESVLKNSEQIIWNRLVDESNISLKRSLWNTYQSLAASSDGLDKIYTIWNKKESIKGLDFSEDDQITMSHNLILNRHSDWENILKEQLERINNPDRKKEYEFLLNALANDYQKNDLFFNTIEKVENRVVENWVSDGLAFIHYPNRNTNAVHYLKSTLELLEEIQQTGDIFFPNAVLKSSLNYHSSDESVDIINQFLLEHPHYPEKLKKKIQQNADLVIRNNIIYNQYIKQKK